MCDNKPVRARAATGPVGTKLPPKGSTARTILRAVCEQYDHLGACYGDALWRDSATTGLVTTRFRIRADGLVEEACFIDTAINDGEMLQCIRERFLQIEVPEIDKDTTVVFPIVYLPSTSQTTSTANPSSCERLRREGAAS
jgi:hypothetical protein